MIAALAGAHAGLPILDPLAALVVAGFIGYAGYQIALTTMKILSDRIVMSESDIERVVLSVDGVLGCHQIRTRGSSDHVFLDFHVWLPADMRLTDAHAISHVVKDRLMARYPQIVDAVIHLEPPPRMAELTVESLPHMRLLGAVLLFLLTAGPLSAQSATRHSKDRHRRRRRK